MVEPTDIQKRIKRNAEELERLCSEVPGLREMCAEFTVKLPATQLYVLKARDPACYGVSILEALIQIRDLIRGYGEIGS